MLNIKNKIKNPLHTFNATGMNEGTAVKLKNAARQDENFVFAMLESSEKGITQMTADERKEKYGLNEVQHDKAPAWFVQLFYAFVNPFIFILVLIACISLVIDVFVAAPADRDFKTVIVVSVMIIISALLRFVQEYRSNKAAEQLKSMVKTTATVLRKMQGKIEIAMAELVPGDIIFLSAGDMVPADCRVLHSKDLFVSESMLTGEALPVEKNYLPVRDAEQKQPTELGNICFMGTNVVSGSATAIVVATGSFTYFGSISKSIVDNRPETSFDKGINKVSFLLIRFMLVMVPLVFLINGLLKGQWTDALLFAIAIAVGLTPEMLPMIVTANLAKGAVNMSRRKVIVKRLNSIQNIGAMDILCTDKTGTLTLDKIVLEKHLNVYGIEDDEVLKWAYLNSYHQTGLKNLLDNAVLEHAELHDYLKVENHFFKVDEIPFDFQRRRMSVILKMSNGRHLLICKGAVDPIIH